MGLKKLFRGALCLPGIKGAFASSALATSSLKAIQLVSEAMELPNSGRGFYGFPVAILTERTGSALGALHVCNVRPPSPDVLPVLVTGGSLNGPGPGRAGGARSPASPFEIAAASWMNPGSLCIQMQPGLCTQWKKRPPFL